MGKANDIYKDAVKHGIYLETTCANISEREWDELYKNATRANKQIVNRIVRQNSLDESGWLTHKSNPYEYFKTSTHLILIHSATDYFFKINK